jgi:hypothetical protein
MPAFFYFVVTAYHAVTGQQDAAVVGSIIRCPYMFLCLYKNIWNLFYCILSY